MNRSRVFHTHKTPGYALLAQRLAALTRGYYLSSRYGWVYSNRRMLRLPPANVFIPFGNVEMRYFKTRVAAPVRSSSACDVMVVFDSLWTTHGS